jgi:hypothetical protein
MQEVLMSLSPIRRGSTQLPLFARPHPKPYWMDLPSDVQQKILQLLTQLLKQHCARPRAAGEAEEGRDE